MGQGHAILLPTPDGRQMWFGGGSDKCWPCLLPEGGAKSAPRGDCYSSFGRERGKPLRAQGFRRDMGAPTFCLGFSRWDSYTKMVSP